MTSPPWAGGVDGGKTSEALGTAVPVGGEGNEPPVFLLLSATTASETNSNLSIARTRQAEVPERRGPVRLLIAAFGVVALLGAGCAPSVPQAAPPPTDLGVLATPEAAPGATSGSPEAGESSRAGEKSEGDVDPSDGTGTGTGTGGQVFVGGDPQTGREPTAARLAEVRPLIEQHVSSTIPGAQIIDIQLGVEYDSWSGAVVRLVTGGTSRALTVTLIRHDNAWKIGGVVPVGGGS